jgi:hypothetical protein
MTNGDLSGCRSIMRGVIKYHATRRDTAAKATLAHTHRLDIILTPYLLNFIVMHELYDCSQRLCLDRVLLYVIDRRTPGKWIRDGRE